MERTREPQIKEGALQSWEHGWRNFCDLECNQWNENLLPLREPQMKQAAQVMY